MGQVALTLKVGLDGPDVDIAAVREKISEAVDVQDIKEVPIAFGLKMLEVLLVFDDKQGADTDAVEEKLRKIVGVSSVESGDVTLI